ncbi:MAG: polysaccharide deacetylase family protein [Nitrospirae bacterium]|nr:polysaccharide deacetylase family protein [Nitrospirota bacterium]
MYHEVTDEPERGKKLRRIDPAYSLSTSQFTEQLNFIRDNGFSVCPLESILFEKDDIINPIVITFDDGLIGNYRFALPILQELNFKATFFVTVEYIEKARYMSWNQINEIHKCGHLVQSHTMTHPMLGEIGDREIYYELSKSKEIIEEKVGEVVRYLSLPFGSYNDNVIKIAKEVGYKAILTSDFNKKQYDEIPFQLGRIPIKDSHSLKTFGNLISQESNSRLGIIMCNCFKSSIKKAIGLGRYRRIYRFFNRIRIEG